MLFNNGELMSTDARAIENPLDSFGRLGRRTTCRCTVPKANPFCWGWGDGGGLAVGTESEIDVDVDVQGCRNQCGFFIDFMLMVSF